MKITTQYVHPPIPIRQFDWQAYFDPEGYIGEGETEAEAIRDLLENTEHDIDEETKDYIEKLDYFYAWCMYCKTAIFEDDDFRGSNCGTYHKHAWCSL